MFSAILVIIGLSVLVLIHEAGHFFAAKKQGLLVEEFGFGFPPRMFAIRRGETEYSFNWLPFGGFVKIYGERAHAENPIDGDGHQQHVDPRRSFSHQSLWKRFVIIAAGISINFVFGWLLLSLVFMIGAPQKVIVTEVQPNSPAQTVGFAVGDEIVGYKTAKEFTQFTASHRGSSVTIDVMRAGHLKEFITGLRTDTTVPALGAGVTEQGFARMGFFESLWQGLTTSISAMGQIFSAFFDLLADLIGHASVPADVVGPVGIFGVAGQLGQLGIVYVLQLIGLISLNLAVLNFIPFPALDGGRILFLIIEKLKGSPISVKREQIATLISFGFLVLLMIIITTRDIVRLF